jgi:hypothetical protein
VKSNYIANKSHFEPGIHRIINIYKFSPYLTEETLHIHYKHEIFNASIRKIFQLFTLWTNGIVFYVTVGDTFLRLNRLEWASHVVMVDHSCIPIEAMRECFTGRRPVGKLEADGRMLFGQMP